MARQVRLARKNLSAKRMGALVPRGGVVYPDVLLQAVARPEGEAALRAAKLAGLMRGQVSSKLDLGKEGGCAALVRAGKDHFKKFTK